MMLKEFSGLQTQAHDEVLRQDSKSTVQIEKTSPKQSPKSSIDLIQLDDYTASNNKVEIARKTVIPVANLDLKNDLNSSFRSNHSQSGQKTHSSRQQV